MPPDSPGFPARLIRHAPALGAWNMAVDEALLESAGQSGIAVLRLYGWSEPTLSLGYFQRCHDRQLHESSRDCPVVRRMSGGGAILHDREATYCLLLPAAHPLATMPEKLYALAHETAIEMIDDRAAKLIAQPADVPASAEPFLCFQRRSVGDLVVDQSKVLGSAQRRRNGVVLQHGSWLLAASRCAPELPGMFDLRPELAKRQTNGWLEAWAERFGERLGLDLQADMLAADEARAAERLVEEKYAAQSWTERR